MGEIVGELFETFVKDGVTYLVKKTVDGLGNKIKQFFRDDDGDGVPDTEEPEWWENDDEETSGGEGEPNLPVNPNPADPPATSEPTTTTVTPQDIGRIVLITPDGPYTIYADNEAADYGELVSLAEERWLERYGATTKDFSNYSVSEALLLIIAGCALFWLFGKIFKRRKL